MAEKGKLHAIFLSCGQLNQNENYERKLQMYISVQIKTKNYSKTTMFI